MVGGGYYDAHSSFQAETAASVTQLLQQAVAALTMPADGQVIVADYGCSEGRNSMATVTTALDLLSARGAKGFGVVHNDLPTNDWNTLARNLSGADSYLAKVPQARALFAPRGFFEKVTTPSSITLGTSGSAAHWLSRQPPDLDMPRSLYRSDAPPPELAKILKQAADDWQSFLAARADELKPGGVLLVQMLGADGSAAPARVSAAGLLKLMNECALQFVDAGDVPQDVYRRYCFPVVPRTIEEAKAPLMGAARTAALRADAGRIAISGGAGENRRCRRVCEELCRVHAGLQRKQSARGAVQIWKGQRGCAGRPVLYGDGEGADHASQRLSVRRSDACSHGAKARLMHRAICA
jgi:hypothetical protein